MNHNPYRSIHLFLLISAVLFSHQSCGYPQEKQHPPLKDVIDIPNDKGGQQQGHTIESRIQPPSGSQRIEAPTGSFAHYLRNIPLWPETHEVRTYQGHIKRNNNIYEAVFKVDVGDKDLQQCADAVMRLKAEYHFEQGEYDQIHFNLTNGFRVDYKEWRKGKRVKVSGNRTWWVETNRESESYESFRDYLEFVFTYAGTLSLSKELKSRNVSDMQIGDVWIQGGSPGHAVLVVDMAIDPKTGEKFFLLAQSYMPAQEIHILVNPQDDGLSPWFSNQLGAYLPTPEWTFQQDDLKYFVDQ